MAKLNYWTDKWDLHVDICPCDVHVNDWLADAEDDEQAGLSLRHRHASRGRQGAGGERLRQHGVRHHRLDRGVRGLCQAGRERTRMWRKAIVAYFGDIYLTNPQLLPDFDVVTMVHLCEFFFPNTASAEYGGIDDRGVLDLFTAKTKPGGHILFYTKSIGFEKAEADRREVGEGSAGHERRRVQDAGGVPEELTRHSRKVPCARTFCVIARSAATKQSSREPAADAALFACAFRARWIASSLRSRNRRRSALCAP